MTGVIGFSSAHVDEPAVDLAAASTIDDEYLTSVAAFRLLPLQKAATGKVE